MLTILFDGVAYGMLLFVLACGLSVTLGLMNFINLAHGAFAMAGGYCTVILVNRLGVPFLLGAADRVSGHRARSAACSSARSIVHVYARKPSRPGAVHHRPRLHVGGGGRLHDGLVAADSSQIPRRCRARSTCSASASADTGCLIIVICGLLDARRCRLDSGARPGSAAGCARRSTISAWRAGSASMSARCSP